MPAGGEISRENGRKGGRPAGALAKMSKRKALELANENRTPLDVMVDNMNWWWEKAKDLGEVVEEKIALLRTTDNVEEIRALMAEVSKISQHFLAARQNAQSCAVDAAPYIHPRITPIVAVLGNDTVKVTKKIERIVTITEISGPGDGRDAAAADATSFSSAH